MKGTILEAGNPEEQYLERLKYLRDHGKKKTDPQKIGNLAHMGFTMRWNPAEMFPMFTTKRMPLKAITVELLWFLSGRTDVAYLHEHGVTIWDEWATEEMCAMYGRSAGELGPIYGEQWRRWRDRDGKAIDQIAVVQESLRKNPDSRRHMIISYNPGDMDKIFIASCHGNIKFHHEEGVLSLDHWQRSADWFLGVPFNMASYSLLLMMMAQVTGLKVGEVSHHTVDSHLYLNHIEQAGIQLARTPRTLPTMKLNPDVKDIFDFRWPEDFKLEGYTPDPNISAPVGI